MKTRQRTIRQGRPRAFDTERALDQALHVFWQHGYEGASLPDLTRAMRINRPSMYAAFGNKEALFKKAIQRYLNGPASYVKQALGAATAREAFERLLVGAADLLSDPRHPKGCLIVQGALACGSDSDPIRKQLIRHRAAGEETIRKRFHRARREGDLPRKASPAALAKFAVTIIHGMSVQAASGANRKALHEVARIAISAWPRG